MTAPNKPVVLIIDSFPLRSLGFISTLNRLNHLVDPTKSPVTFHIPDIAGPFNDAPTNCEMLIYTVGGARPAGCDNLERIKALRAVAPDVPLMILSDNESRADIISKLNVGAQGLLMPIGGSAFSAPSDAKFACLDRNHEEKIPHRVGLYQVRERSLAIPLPAGHRVSEEAQRCFDLGQAAIRPTRPTGLALAKTAA